MRYNPQAGPQNGRLAVSVTDEGRGHHPVNADLQLLGADPHGRGLKLIKNHSDSVEYVDEGRTTRMIFMHGG